ncbi:hypothetical protein [Paenibacillus sp. FSL H8-0034]|uniref:hypothetical protein n=1 Tax=Paenibacillus sp. FSL H8-0034 TaxID=2954671 RepID=UPI0030F73CA9
MLINQISKLIKSANTIGRGKYRAVDPGNSDNNIQKFVRSLELSDEEILNRFQLTLNGKQLTDEQARHFIAIVRQEKGRYQAEQN